MSCVLAYTLSATYGRAFIEEYSIAKTSPREYPENEISSFSHSVSTVKAVLSQYILDKVECVSRSYHDVFSVDEGGDVSSDVIGGTIDIFSHNAPYPLTTTDTTYQAARCIIPDDHPQVIWDGEDITEFVKSIRVSGAMGQQSTASLILANYDSDGMLALRNAFNPLTNSDVKAFNRNSPTAKTLTIKLRMGNTSPRYPTFIPQDPQLLDDGTVSWEFSDFTPVLDLDNQSVDDVSYSEGDDVTASEMIKTLAAMAGITKVACRFKDYQLRTFRLAQGNIKSAIDELCSYTQSYARWIGDTLELAPLFGGDTIKSGTIITDRFHIPQDGIQMGHDTSNLKTLFKIMRLSPLSTALASPIDCTGGQCVGRVVRIDFDQPVSSAYVIVKAREGSIRDGVFHTEEGEPINNTPSNVLRSSKKKAKYWIGTYFPRFTRREKYIPYWRVEAYGNSSRSTAEEEFTLQKILAEAEAKFGRRPEYKNLESEVFLRQVTAQNMLDAIANEIEWGVVKGSVTTPFLTRELAGDMVRISDYQSSLDREPFVVAGYDHTWTPEGGITNTLNLRGRL